MEKTSSLFFCAVGGSGMMPLALMMKARGADVRGSDRSYDQGRLLERFAFLKNQGIALFPQDGSGVTAEIGQVIISAAVEETVPDVQAALKQNIPIRRRAELLAENFNAARAGIAVAGTSGKSTTTGMIGWILQACGKNPTIVNGAVMKNFVSKETPFASAVVGDPDLFVAEVDESDGSIAGYIPTIAVLNNLALDHKSLEELRCLFGSFLEKSKKIVVNLDNEETMKLAENLKNKWEARLPPTLRFGATSRGHDDNFIKSENLSLNENRLESILSPTHQTVTPAKDGIPFSFLTYSLSQKEATLLASDIVFYPDSVSFTARYAPTKERTFIKLTMPGRHNVSNALAALGAALAAGVPFQDAAQALASFQGIARRLDVVGTTGGVTVIDDFAHNPDKIAATLSCLHQFPGRLLILFQLHGYGPLRLLKDELAACFQKYLAPEDRLWLPDPLYLGGTTDRSVGSADLAKDIGKQAAYLPDRETCAKAILAEARAGDRLLVMGARDDTLSVMAKEIFKSLTN